MTFTLILPRFTISALWLFLIKNFIFEILNDDSFAQEIFSSFLKFMQSFSSALTFYLFKIIQHFKIFSILVMLSYLVRTSHFFNSSGNFLLLIDFTAQKSIIHKKFWKANFNCILNLNQKKSCRNINFNFEPQFQNLCI